MEILLGVGLHAWCPVALKIFVAFSKDGNVQKNIYHLCKVKRLEQDIKSRCKPTLLIKCMKTELFHYKTKNDMHVRSIQFSILCNPANSSDKTQMMYSTILLCLFTPKYDINGSRLNCSAVSRNKFKYINMKIIYSTRTCVALKTPLEIRLGICIYKTSLLHRPDDYIGFTSRCPPTFYNKIAPMLSALQVGISEENALSTSTQQFMTAKISGCALKRK